MPPSNPPTAGEPNVVLAFPLQEKLERELHSLRAERDELHLRLTAIPRATTHAALQLVEADKALLSIRKARDSVLARSIQLTEELAAAKDTIAELRDATEFAEHARQAALDQLQVSQKECAELRTQLAEARQAASNAQPTPVIAEQVAQLVAERARLQQEFDLWKSASHVQIAALQAQLMDRSKENTAAAKSEDHRLQIAELRVELDSLREELRRERNSYFESTPAPPPPSIPEPIGVQASDSVPNVETDLQGMRLALKSIASDPSHLEALDVVASQFQDLAQRTLSAGCVAAHRLSTLCAEVAVWMRKSPGKIASMLPALDRACKLISQLSHANVAARVGDPAGSLVHAVDDDVDNCECIAMALEKIGFRTRYSIKADMALNELSKSSCDLLILDIDLGGGMDGLQLNERIKQMEHFRHKPVLYVSGLPSAHERVTAMHGNDEDLIEKPYNLNALTLKVLTSLLTARLGTS